jgi:hypothetical protein
MGGPSIDTRRLFLGRASSVMKSHSAVSQGNVTRRKEALCGCSRLRNPIFAIG